MSSRNTFHNPPTGKPRKNTSSPSSLRNRSTFSVSNGNVTVPLSQTREELIVRYEQLADQYAASLNERDELKRQKKNLELEVASINKQKARLQELLEDIKSEKAAANKPK